MKIDIPHTVAFVPFDRKRDALDAPPVLCFSCAVKAVVAGERVGARLKDSSDRDDLGSTCVECSSWL